MERNYIRSNRINRRGVKMLDLKERLELQDLIKELEENDIKYNININKVLKTGKITTLDIEVFIWLN